MLLSPMCIPAAPAPLSDRLFWLSDDPLKVRLGSTVHAPTASRAPPRTEAPNPKPLTPLLTAAL